MATTHYDQTLIYNGISFGIKNSILNPLNKNGEFLGEIMSDIIYSTNFELGTWLLLIATLPRTKRIPNVVDIGLMVELE